MMGNRRPVCHLVKREDRFVTEITTQSNWTRNLVQNDVLWGNVNTDFDALQILAQCKMLFPHMMNELPLASPCSSVRKILHLVQCETKAHFSLVNMMRLVKSFEQKLRTAVASWPENKQSCYEALDKIFCLYGFLVPTKITLGKLWYFIAICQHPITQKSHALTNSSLPPLISFIRKKEDSSTRICGGCFQIQISVNVSQSTSKQIFGADEFYGWWLERYTW